MRINEGSCSLNLLVDWSACIHNIALVDLLQLLVRHVSDALQVEHELDELILLKAKLTEFDEFMLEDVAQAHGLVGSVSSWELDESAVVLLSTLGLDVQASWDSLGVEIVELASSVLELNLIHKRPGDLVVDGGLGVVLGDKHQVLPELLGVVIAPDEVILLESLPEDGRDDVHHTVVSTLPRGWSPFGGVSNDAESGLVAGDLDRVDVAWAVSKDVLDVLGDDVDQSVDGTGTLMLIETELEVHPHDGEVASGMSQDEVERRVIVV